MMQDIIHELSSKPLPTIGTTTGISVGGTVISFSTDILPVVQLMAAFVAVVSGMIGIAIGIWHLKEILRKERDRENNG